jgi:hypothetical protein
MHPYTETSVCWRLGKGSRHITGTLIRNEDLPKERGSGLIAVSSC